MRDGASSPHGQISDPGFGSVASIPGGYRVRGCGRGAGSPFRFARTSRFVGRSPARVPDTRGMRLTLAEIAAHVQGRVAGDGQRVVTGVAAIESAGAGDLTFVASARLVPRLEESAAGAAIVPEGVDAASRDVVLHDNPRAAMAIAIRLFHPEERPAAGVSEHASVHATARLGEGVSVGAFTVVGEGAVLGDDVVVGPGCVVAGGVRVGARTVLHAHVVLYPRVSLGEDCVLHSGVVVGSDGFGFTLVAGKHTKVPQIGGVEIGDDVEIGAGSCVDAGALAPTRIGDNTKIDNLVQVGHNTQLGRSVLLCGQSGIAGSSVLEDYVTLAGQAGVGGHLRMGQGSAAAAQSAVLKDVARGQVVAGAPNMSMNLWKRVHASSKHLPDMRDQLKALQKQVDELTARLAETPTPGDAPNTP